VAVTGARSGAAAAGAKTAIPGAEAMSLAPRVAGADHTARTAPGRGLVSRVAFPRGRLSEVEGLAISPWWSAGPPKPVEVTSLSVGSGSALAVSVVLPSVRQSAKSGLAELAASPAAAIRGPDLRSDVPATAVSGASFAIPAAELTPCATPGPAAGSILAASGLGLPELRPVVDEGGARVEWAAMPAWRPAPRSPEVGLRPGMGALGLAPPAEAPGPLPQSGAPAGVLVSSGTFTVCAADVRGPEALGGRALSIAACNPLGSGQPAVIPRVAATGSEFRPVAATASYPAIRPAVASAALGTTECGWLDKLLPGIVRPEAAGTYAGWLSRVAGTAVGLSGLSVESAGLRPAAEAEVRPARAVGPASSTALVRAWSGPATIVPAMLPGRVEVRQRAGVMSGLAELRPVAPRSVRIPEAEAGKACLSPRPPRPAWPESQAAPRAAYTFPRYGERNPGRGPKVGHADPVGLDAEPLWMTRAKRPAGATSLAITEFVAPPVPPVWIQLLNVWQGFPAALRGAVASVALVTGLSLLIWAAAGQAITARLEQRAAIELQEDFRQGLRGWMGAPGWIESWRRQPAGYVEVSQLALWRPTRKLSDYQLEFLAQLTGKTLGWVFRAGDLENYYSMRLTVLKPGPLPTVALVRSVVVGGREQEKVQVPLRVRIQQSAPVRVRVLVRGDGFTTWIGDQLADYWRNDRFRQGAIGFYAEGGDRAQLFWVKVTHQDDFLGKLCAYLAPSRREENGL